jgi:hypothetical protein
MAGSLKMNTAVEYSTRVVQEGGRRCKKSTLNELVHLTPLRIPLMNPPLQYELHVIMRTCTGTPKYNFFSVICPILFFFSSFLAILWLHTRSS